MTSKPTLIERATELAAGGVCQTVAEIKRQLASEGYATGALGEKEVARQLRDLIASADRTARPFRSK